MPQAPNQTFAVVDAPPAVPPDVGLLASLPPSYKIDDTGASANGTGPQRWEGGLQYAPEQVCYEMLVTDPCSVTPMDTPPNPGLVQNMPMQCWAGDTCSTFGWSARDYVGRATRALLGCESKQIAKELWTGRQAKLSGWPNTYLASASAVVLSPSPQTPAAALGFLEQGIANTSNGQPGMIHCTRQLGVTWSEQGNTFRSVNGVIVSYMGTIIVPDAGYDGSSPAGAPGATTQWAYATQMVTVRRSPVIVVPDNMGEATVRSTNSITWRAYRYASATFPPCTLVACEVSLPVPVGGAS